MNIRMYECSLEMVKEGLHVVKGASGCCDIQKLLPSVQLSMQNFLDYGYRIGIRGKSVEYWCLTLQSVALGRR